MIVKATENVRATPKARMSVYERRLFFTGPVRRSEVERKEIKLIENVMKGMSTENTEIMRAPWVSEETSG